MLRLSYWLLLLCCLTLTACGGGGGGGSAPGGSSQGGGTPNAPAPKTGTIEVRNVLARSVPTAVDQLRFTGRTSGAAVAYGPELRTKSPLVVLSDVPTSVVSLQVEYLAGGKVVGTFTGPVSVPPGGTVQVNDPAWHDVVTLQRIQISPPAPAVAAGLSLQLHATGVFSDDTTQDLTGSGNWSSADPARASVASGLVRGLQAGATNVTATLGDVQATVPLTVSAAVLQSLEIQGSGSVARGVSTQLVARGILSDGTHPDLTSQVVWSVTPSSLAGVSASGLATGLQVGQGQVHADLQGVQGTLAFRVTDAVPTRVEVSPALSDVALGFKQQFTATLILSDGSKQDVSSAATWSSSQPSTAAVDGAGLASTLAQGSAEIRADYQAFRGTGNLTVSAAVLQSLEVSPPDYGTSKGLTVQYSAVGRFSDGQVRSVQGLLWSSSNEQLVAIGVQDGLATTLAQGNVTISASAQGVTGSTHLGVGPAMLESLQIVGPTILDLGLGAQLGALGHYSDGSVQNVTADVLWTIGNTSVATVSATGFVQSVAEGGTPVRAQLQGKSIQAPIIVAPKALRQILISPSDPTIHARQSVRLQAQLVYSDNTTMDVTPLAVWSTTNPASVSNGQSDSGNVTSATAGNYTVTASYRGLSGSTVVHVLYPSFTYLTVDGPPTLPAPGVQLSLTAKVSTPGQVDDATDYAEFVTWTSLTPDLLSVSNAPGTRGRITALRPGTASVQAELEGVRVVYSPTIQDRRIQSIEVQTDTDQILGSTYEIVVVATFDNATQANVTQFAEVLSSNPSVVVVGRPDREVAVGVGQAVLTATVGSFSDTLTVNVRAR